MINIYYKILFFICCWVVLFLFVLFFVQLVPIRPKDVQQLNNW